MCLCVCFYLLPKPQPLSRGSWERGEGGERGGGLPRADSRAGSRRHDSSLSGPSAPYRASPLPGLRKTTPRGGGSLRTLCPRPPPACSRIGHAPVALWIRCDDRLRRRGVPAGTSAVRVLGRHLWVRERKREEGGVWRTRSGPHPRTRTRRTWCTWARCRAGRWGSACEAQRCRVEKGPPVYARSQGCWHQRFGSRVPLLT